MRRSDIFNNINQNNNAFYNHLNLISPRDLRPETNIEEIWIEDNRVSTGVQIVELNSSDNPVTSSEDDKEKTNRNSWIYGNQESFQEGDNYYKANEGARERRRKRNQFGDQLSTHKQTEYETFVCPGFYGPPENVIFDHQMNCFTILDKHFVMGSQSSSENEYADIEEFSCGDHGFGQWSNHDNSTAGNNVGEIVSAEPEPDMQKRTVWIYSYKNRHRLNESDFDPMNVPSCDTSNSSFEESEELSSRREGRSYRLATPIPPAHVPKLNLTISPKLPTVTEVSEPQKISSANQTDNTFGETLKPKPFNNWFRSANATPHSAQYNRDKNNSVLNWMALSPRNRKRKVTPSPVKKQILPTLREVSSVIEKTSQKLQQCDESSKNLTSKVQVETQAEVHLESTSHNKATETENFDTPDGSPYMQAGDCETREVKSKERIRKLQIRFSPKPILKVSEITEPIEKLEGDKWIVEDNKYAHVPYYYRYEVKVDDPEERDRGDSAGDTLLIRNMSLLKPAHWAEYLPITGSIPSLHLSMNTDSVSDMGRQSWFKRITKWFRCCK